MALIADSPADRAEQLITLSERLSHLIAEETRRIEAREPTAPAEIAAEKERLANAYRLELARIKDDPALIAPAPAALKQKLKERTLALQAALNSHEIALGAVKYVAEGLAQAMAEEIARQKREALPYAPNGARSPSGGPTPVALDRKA